MSDSQKYLAQDYVWNNVWVFSLDIEPNDSSQQLGHILFSVVLYTHELLSQDEER